uniref:DUF7041 domain-containing protein n=1 Tax=Trichogramma kaykai TaxID=54128 RepID=A0ABD2W5P8_9HYME
MPSFWLDKLAAWFAQAEAQFALGTITTELTKYYHVISQLDVCAAAEVEDIITNPPVNQPNTHLRQQLIVSIDCHHLKSSASVSYCTTKSSMIVSHHNFCDT